MYPIPAGTVIVAFHFEVGDANPNVPNPSVIQNDSDLENYLNNVVLPFIAAVPGTLVEGSYHITNGVVSPPRVTAPRYGTTCSSSLTSAPDA